MSEGSRRATQCGRWSHGTRGLRIACLAVILPLAGCYRYTPMQPTEAAVGRKVRLRVSGEGEARLQGVLPDDVGQLEGSVIRNIDGALLLSVRVRASGPLPGQGLSQWIDLARAEIVTLELKELDRKRTAFALGAAGGGLVALLIKTLSGETRNSSGPPAIDGSESVVPVFVRVPLF